MKKRRLRAITLQGTIEKNPILPILLWMIREQINIKRDNFIHNFFFTNKRRLRAITLHGIIEKSHYIMQVCNALCLNRPSFICSFHFTKRCADFNFIYYLLLSKNWIFFQYIFNIYLGKNIVRKQSCKTMMSFFICIFKLYNISSLPTLNNSIQTPNL